MAKAKSLFSIGKSAYDRTRAALLRQGVDKTLANASARSSSALAKEKTLIRREKDLAYRQKVREVEKLTGFHDLALEEGRKARKAVSEKFEEPAITPGEAPPPEIPPIDGEYCSIAKIQRFGKQGTRYVQVEVGQVPDAVLEQVPPLGHSVLRGYYGVCEADKADYWYAILVSKGGFIIDSTIRLLTRNDALANAIARAELPSGSLPDSKRGHNPIFIILIPVLRYLEGERDIKFREGGKDRLDREDDNGGEDA